MSNYYYLNDDHSVMPCSSSLWSIQFEEMKKNDTRHVNVDEINGCRVSTVWLGLNHNFFNEEVPLIFETIIFNENSDSIYMDRYSTWEEAQQGHEKAIQWVLDGDKDDK